MLCCETRKEGDTDVLELGIGEVAAHHHLEHLEQLAVRDEAVVVDVVHLEGDCAIVWKETISERDSRADKYSRDDRREREMAASLISVCVCVCVCVKEHVQRSLPSRLFLLVKVERAFTNSLNSISSSLLVSKMAMILLSSGLPASSGIDRNSSARQS
jgi:hypothetical protein